MSVSSSLRLCRPLVVFLLASSADYADTAVDDNVLRLQQFATRQQVTPRGGAAVCFPTTGVSVVSFRLLLRVEQYQTRANNFISCSKAQNLFLWQCGGVQVPDLSLEL